MAKTTRDKPKKVAEKPDTGPVLVAEPNEIAEDIPEEFEESEEATPSDSEVDANDPRRIPPMQRFELAHQPQWWGFLKQFPDPINCDLYGYRLFPSIMLSPPADWTSRQKPPTHIFKIKGLITPETNQVVDYEWLRNTWGSGKYQLRMVDRTLKRTQNRQICTAIVEVNEWDTHLCVLGDWSELVPNEGNKWVISRLLKDKIIKRNNEGGFMAFSEGAAVTTNGATPDVAMLDKVLGFAERQFARNTQSTDKQQESVGLKAMDIMASTVKDVMKEATKPPTPPPPPDNTVVTLLTTMLENQRIAAENQRKENEAARAREAADAAAARQREHELLKEMLAEARKPAPAPPNPMDQMDTVLGIFDKLKDKLGGGDSEAARASRMSATQEFWQPIITEGQKTIAPLVDAGAKIMLHKAMQANQQQIGQRPGQQPQQQRPPGQSFVSPAAEVAAPPAPQQPQPPAPMQHQQTQPAPPEQQQPATAEPDQQQPPMMPMNIQEQYKAQVIAVCLNRYMATIRKRLADPTEEGQYLASLMCDDTIDLGNLPPFSMDGEEAFTRAKEAGREYLLDQFRQAPQLWEEFAGTPEKAQRFVRFIDEFLAYDPEKGIQQ